MNVSSSPATLQPLNLVTRSRRIEWARCGFGAGVLGYVVLSAVSGTLPDETSLRAAWLGTGMAPAMIGSGLGFTLARWFD